MQRPRQMKLLILLLRKRMPRDQKRSTFADSKVTLPLPPSCRGWSVLHQGGGAICATSGAIRPTVAAGLREPRTPHSATSLPRAGHPPPPRAPQPRPWRAPRCIPKGELNEMAAERLSSRASCPFFLLARQPIHARQAARAPATRRLFLAAGSIGPGCRSGTPPAPKGT